MAVYYTHFKKRYRATMRVTRYDELGSIGAIVMDRMRPIALELRAQYTLLQ